MSFVKTGQSELIGLLKEENKQEFIKCAKCKQEYHAYISECPYCQYNEYNKNIKKN